MTQDEMVGWHHGLSGYESEQTPGNGEGQGSLACCSPWGHRVRHNLVPQQQPPPPPAGESLLRFLKWSQTHVYGPNKWLLLKCSLGF